MSLFRYLFPRKSQVTIGSFWVHDSDYDNPFERNIVYKVDDVKSNWVKYTCYGRIGFITTMSRNIKFFYAFYRKLDKAPDNISFKD